MPSALCVSCRDPKTTSKCDACSGLLCKSCVQYLEPDTFAFLEKPHPEVSHLWYCRFCYDAEVEPRLQAYQALKEKAGDVLIFFKTQKKNPTILKRSKIKVTVDSCIDRDETILRLAFFAAQLKMNALIAVEITSTKVRNEGYQHYLWSGHGVPAIVDETRLERSASED